MRQRAWLRRVTLPHDRWTDPAPRDYAGRACDPERIERSIERACPDHQMKDATPEKFADLRIGARTSALVVARSVLPDPGALGRFSISTGSVDAS
jgi:hypothetical protein